MQENTYPTRGYILRRFKWFSRSFSTDQEVLVIQNQKANKHSPTIICLVGISAKNTNIQLRISKEMLTYNDGLNYITTIDKERILNNSFVGRLDSTAMKEVKGRLAQILFGMTMRMDIKNY